MAIIQLAADHPHKQKFEQLCAFADSLSISIEFFYNRTLVYIEDQDYDLMDLEDDELGNSVVSEFPHPTEYKLTRWVSDNV